MIGEIDAQVSGLQSEQSDNSEKTGENAVVAVEEQSSGDLEVVNADVTNSEARIDDSMSQKVEEVALSPEEIGDKYANLNEVFEEESIALGDRLENLMVSTGDSEGVSGEQYDSLKEDLDAQLSKIEELLEVNFPEEDRDEANTRLLEMRSVVLNYKIDLIKSALPSELLSATTTKDFLRGLAEMGLDTPEERRAFVENFTSLADAEDDPSVDSSSQVSRIAKALKEGGQVAGMALSVFVDLDIGDFGAFISFILNPTGGSGGGYEYKYSGEKGEIIPYYVFKEKFKNHDLVGRAMSGFANKNADRLGVGGWREDNSSDLSSISESGNFTKTHGILASFYGAALREGANNSKENWEVFEKEFTSEMFGGKEVSMDEETKEFLKNLLKNEAEGLRKFWKMDVESSDEKSDPDEEVESS